MDLLSQLIIEVGFHNLHRSGPRVQNWGIYFLDPNGGGSGMKMN